MTAEMVKVDRPGSKACIHRTISFSKESHNAACAHWQLKFNHSEPLWHNILD